MTDSPDNIRARMKELHSMLLATVHSEGAAALNGAALEAAARGCCAWLRIFPEDRKTVMTVNSIREHCLLELRTKQDDIRPDYALYCVLAMYHAAYSPAVHPTDYSEAGQCDMEASRLLDALIKRANGEEETILMMQTATVLCSYLVPEDLEDEPVAEFFRTNASAWETVLSGQEWQGTAAEPVMMRRMAALDAGADIFGTWHPALLPSPEQLSAPESLAALCSILARRCCDPTALNAAGTALQQHLSGLCTPACLASLLEALSTLLLITEKGTALNCA